MLLDIFVKKMGFIILCVEMKLVCHSKGNSDSLALATSIDQNHQDLTCNQSYIC